MSLSSDGQWLAGWQWEDEPGSRIEVFAWNLSQGSHRIMPRDREGSESAQKAMRERWSSSGAKLEPLRRCYLSFAAGSHHLIVQWFWGVELWDVPTTRVHLLMEQEGFREIEIARIPPSG